MRYASERGAHVTGVDFVDEMITAALERRETLPVKERTRLDFRVGDVRCLDFEDATFDRVVSSRVIINLPTKEDQSTGLRECARVLRPDGYLLLSEAIAEGWRQLNVLRREWGLDDIPMPPFNRYLNVDDVVRELEGRLSLQRMTDFASSYYLTTRVLKPLLAHMASVKIDVADPNAEFNRWAAALPPVGDYGTQKLLVFQKSY